MFQFYYTSYEQQGKGAIQENIPETGKTGIFPKRPTAANVVTVRKIRHMIILVNLPTQREMALKCGVYLGTVN